jgi:hypothetical protein
MRIGSTYFAFPCLVGYVFSLILANFAIRLGMSLLRTWQLYHHRLPPNFEHVLWLDFSGRSPIKKARDDLVPAYIGAIELLLYPLLIVTMNWAPIGGWLTVKTAANWRWQDTKDGQSWMRFLLGNALVILFSGLLATMIHVHKF